MNEYDGGRIGRRFEKLEKRVDELHKAVEQLLALVQTSAESDADPVGASFRRFQQDADRQMGRG
jgi:CRISPR/Cas system-associated protein Cas7 (RAMP superfamily)